MNENENENLQPVQKLTPFTKMVMSIGTLPSSFYASMSYYESMVWLYEYLKNEVIPTVNNNGEAVEELQDKYIILKNAFDTLETFIDNYFDNLDVQEEINTKLDEMAEDGTLTNLIENYINPLFNDYKEGINNIISEQNNEISSFKSTVNGSISSMNSAISTINTKVDNATSGSPKGVYATVAALTAANPNHDYIYVVEEDGKWYYYNSTSSSWTAGGTYQSSVISDDSVSLSSLDLDNRTGLYRIIDDPKYMTWAYYAYLNGMYSNMIRVKKGETLEFSNTIMQNYKYTIEAYDPTAQNLIKVLAYNRTIASFTFDDNYYITILLQALDSEYSIPNPFTLSKSDLTIKYYIDQTSINKFLSFDKDIFKSQLCGAVYSSPSPYKFVLSTNRLAIPKILNNERPIHIHIKDTTFDYGIIKWSSTDIPTATVLSDSGWINTDYTIPANTNFSFSFKAHDNSNTFMKLVLTNQKSLNDIFEFKEYRNDSELATFISTVTRPSYDYNYSGEHLNISNQYGFDIEEYMNIDLMGYVLSSQGFTIYDKYLIQLFGGTLVQVYDLETKQLIGYSNSDLSYDHGDCITFGKHKFAETDMFPLMYISSDETPNIVYVMRIVDATHSYIIKKYTFPLTDGYYSGNVVDPENEILYNRAYKLQSFTDPTNNAMICTSYDLTKETHVSGNEYTLEMIEQHEEPFVYCEQGSNFHNGLIYIPSSYATGTTCIYVNDPKQKKIIASFTSFPTEVKNNELEGIGFYTVNGITYPIIGNRTKYYKMTLEP